MPQVTMPDGTVEDLPIPTTDQDKAAMSAYLDYREQLAKNAPNKVAPAPSKDTPTSPASDPLHGAKLGFSSVLRGLASVPALVADLATTGVGGLREVLGVGPRAEPHFAATNFVQSLGTQPNNEFEKGLNRVIEGVGGNLVPGLGAAMSPVRSAAIATGSSLGAEAGRQLVPSHPAIASLVGALAGGAPVAAASVMRSNVPEMVDMATKNIPKEELVQALARVQQAPGPLNLAQGMNRTTGLNTLIDDLAGSKQGGDLSAMLQQQPAIASKMAASSVAGLPGKALAPQVVENNAQEAATKLIKTQEQGATAAASPYFEAAKKQELAPANAGEDIQVPTSTIPALSPIFDVIKTIKADKATPPNTINSLTSLEQALDKTGGNVGALDEVAKQWKDKIALGPINENGLDKNTSRLVGGVIRNLDEVLASHAVDAAGNNYLQQGKRVFQQRYNMAVNPMKQGVVGDLAGPAGFDAAKPAPSTLLPLLEAGTDPRASSSKILQAADALKSENPDAFVNAVQTHFSGRLADISLNHAQLADDQFAAQVKKAFVGSAATKQGTRDELIGVARSRDLPDDALYPGFEKMLDYVARTSERPANASGVNAQNIYDVGEHSIPGRIAQYIGISGKPIGQDFRNWVNSGTREKMSQLLADPAKMQVLLEISKTSPTSRKMETLVRAYLAPTTSEERQP